MLRQRMGSCHLLFGNLCGKTVQGPCTPGKFSLTLLQGEKVIGCRSVPHVSTSIWQTELQQFSSSQMYFHIVVSIISNYVFRQAPPWGIKVCNVLYPALDPFHRKPVDKPGVPSNLRHGYACAITEDQTEKINLGMILFEHSENTNAWDIIEFKTHFGVTPWTRVDISSIEAWKQCR